MGALSRFAACGVLIWLVGRAMVMPAVASDRAEIRAGSELDFRPYCFTDRNGQPAGLGPEWLKAAADKMGLRVRITPGPWDQVWDALVAGQLDVLPVVARTPGREPLVDFCLPHTETFDAFFRRAGQPAWPTLAAAAGKEIVVLRSDAAHHELVERRFAGKVIAVQSIPEGLRLVAAGKHDAFLCSKLIGVLEREQAGIKGIEPGPPIPDYQRVFSFAVRKGNAELVEKLNQGLLLVKADGTYDRIYRRWLTVEDPWRKWLPYFQGTVIALVLLAGVVIVLQWLVRRRTRELAIEVAERRRAEGELKELNATLEGRVAERTAEARSSEERFRAILEGSRDMIYRRNLRTGRYEYVSPSVQDVLGHTPQELMSLDSAAALEMVHPEDRPAFLAAVDNLETAGKAEVEYRQLARDGSYRWLSNLMHVTRDADGQPLYHNGCIRDVTARKQAEAAVLSSEHRLRMLTDSAPVMLGHWDLEHRFKFANLTYAARFGLTPEQIIGKHMRDVVGAQAYATIQPYLDRGLRGELSDYELEITYDQLGRFWMQVSYTLEHNEAGQVIGIVGAIQDITARKQAEEALRASEQRLALATTGTQLGIFEWNVATGEVTATEQAAELIGLRTTTTTTLSQQYHYHKWAQRIHPEDLPRVEAELRQCQAAGVAYQTEYRVIWPDGSVHWLADRGVFMPLSPPEGKGQGEGATVPLRLLGVVMDITARKQAETELARTKTLLETLLATAPLGFCHLDREFRFLRINDRLAEMNGVTVADTLGKTVAEIVPAVVPALQEVTDRILATGEAVVGQEFSGETPAQPGVTRWWSESWYPVHDPAGAITGFGAIVEDITDRKAAEERLRRNEETFHRLVEENPFGIYVIDADFKMREASQGARLAFCNVPTPLIGTDLGVCLRTMWAEPFASQAIARFRHTLATGEPYISRSTVERRRDSGDVEAYDWRIERVMLPDGRLGVVCYSYDLSERQKLEADLRRAKAAAEQASKAKDQFIAVLSHELRTPLTPAVAALALLRSDVRLPADARDDLAMVSRNIDLEVRLIADLLDVSRIISGKLHLEKRPVDVGAAIREAGAIVSGDLDAKGQTLSIETPQGPYLTFADAARLQQVFWNLLRNAIKFSPERSAISVRATVVDVDSCPLAAQPCPMGRGDCPQPQASHSDGHPGAGNLVIEVTDQGSGIAPAMLPRLFNAFEQDPSARSFGGLGLGLSICKAVVEMHGGTIAAHSDGIGHGATFTVRLPVAQCPRAVTDVLAKPREAVAGARPVQGSEHALRVLLIEDHAETAIFMARLLRAQGFKVRTAGSVASGLAAAREDQPDVVISDIGLPDGSGLDLMRQLREEGYDMPAIALSGYGTAADIEQSRAAGFAEHLVKPFGSVDLLMAALSRLGVRRGGQSVTRD